MYSDYESPSVDQIPISAQISAKFSSTASKLNTKIVKNYLRHNVGEQRVVYQTFGQFVRVDDDGSLVLPTSLPPINGNNKHNHHSSSNGFSMDSFNLFGKAIQNRTAMVSTPEKDRRLKREKLTELEKRHLPDPDIILDWDLVDVDHLEVDKVPDGVLNEYPAWEDQISGIEKRAPELMLVENDDRSLKLMAELEKHWLIWNSKFRLDFQDKGKQLVTANSHISFDQRPEWQLYPIIPEEVQSTHSNENGNEDVQALTGTRQHLNDTIRLHLSIITDFWANAAPKLIHDWSKFFKCSQQIYLQDVHNEMLSFLHGALKISKFDWPLQICSILLENSKYWIEWLVDDVKCNKFFDSIASLQTNLLCQVIYTNIEKLMHEMSQCKVTKLFCIKVPVHGRKFDQFAAWTIFQELVELGTDVLRCECRMYPNLFSGHTFSVSNAVIFEKFGMNAFDPFSKLADELVVVEGKLTQIPEAADPVELFLEILGDLKELRKECLLIKTMWFSEPYEFDYSDVKEQMLNNISDALDLLSNEITSHLYSFIRRIVDFYTQTTQKLYKKDQFAQMYNLMEVREKDLPHVQKLVKDFHAMFWKIADGFEFSEVLLHKYYQASRTPHRLNYLINLVWQRLQVDRKNIEKTVTEKSNVIYYEAEMLDRELKTAMKKYRSTHSTLEVKQLSQRFGDIAFKISRIAEDYPVVSNQLALLGLDPINIDVPMLKLRASTFASVSLVHREIIVCEETYMNAKLSEVNRDEINNQVSQLNVKFNRIKELCQNVELEEWSKETLALLLTKIEAILQTFNDVLPVLNALTSEGMKRRHWNDILTDNKEGVNEEEIKEKLLIKDLVSMNLTEKAEKCEEISMLASKEMILEDSLSGMKEQWNDFPMQATQNPTTGIWSMKMSPELLITLEEQIIKTQMSISSPFAQNLMSALKEWLQKLQHLQTIFDEYQKADTKWAYLEPLFSAEDIAYQMPDEWRMYQQVAAKWSKLTERFAGTSKFFDLCSMEDVGKEFTEILDTFHNIQCGFDIYLQKRKLNYPRLYYLSNNELLEMLAKSKNPEAVEPYLVKMFASITKLEFNTRGEICAVYSANGEKFTLIRNVNVNVTKRHVDKWLMELEREMRSSVKSRLKALVKALMLDFPDLASLLGKYCAQSILLYYRISCTHAVEKAIVAGKLDSLQTKLNKFLEICYEFKSKYTGHDEIVLLENLLIDVNIYREIVTNLIECECSSADRYEWTSYLRYYWSNDNLFVRIFNLSTLYNYEYLSIQIPFILTPHVRQIHGQLIVLQHQGYAGILKGPAATGKSESIKELAKILGRFCVVFNCSAQVDRKKLEDLLCGTILSGSVLCLDEFNRLPEEVMAWMANHLLGIYQSIASGSFHYQIGTLNMTINPSAAFFLTMNPMFLARNSLPANVHSAIKCLSVESADVQSIASSYLLLAGFKTMTKSSQLIASTFKQCDLSLSPMQHYDFHLRAVLAAVADAIQCKKGLNTKILELDTEAQLNFERELAGKSTHDLIGPVLVKSDMSLFDSIFHSNFQTNHLMLTDEEQSLADKLTDICRRMELQAGKAFIKVTTHLYRLSRLHQAFILLGDALTGKSTVVSVVSQLLRETHLIDCTIFRLNPSQFDSPTLYGHYDGQRLEWIPGILSQQLATKLPEDGSKELWIILDGVLDSRWIESMNSLLDNNRKLCLANGETIFLSPHIRLVFETDSLEQLAASTVSRCRLVYFHEDTLPMTAWNMFSELENVETIYANLKQFRLLTNYHKKLYLDKVNGLYKFFGGFTQTEDAKPLRDFIQLIAVWTSMALDKCDRWLERCRIDEKKVLARIPQAGLGQWFDMSRQSSTNLSESKQTELRLGFLKQLLRQLIRMNKYMLVVYGRSGCGKSRFIFDLTSGLSSDRWSIHLLNLSAETDAAHLLNAILGCNLIRESYWLIHVGSCSANPRMRGNMYTSPNEKSVLIVLEGFSRLRHTSDNCAYEMMRTLFDTGKILNATTGEEIKFTSVHFLAEFTTDLTDPEKLAIPTRFRRFIFPYQCENVDHRNPSNVCEAFSQMYSMTTKPKDAKDAQLQKAVELVIQSEIKRNSGKVEEQDIIPLCHKYVYAVRPYKEPSEKEEKSVVTSFQKSNQPEIVSVKVAQEELEKLLATKKLGPSQQTFSRLHKHLTAHVVFLHKILAMPGDGHCVLIGNCENDANTICEIAVHVSLHNFHYELLNVELSDLTWKETLTKLIRMCVIEKRRVLLHVTDEIFNKSTLETVLSDLIVIINRGGLPTRLFNQQLLNELNEQSQQQMEIGASHASSTEWKQREIISKDIRKYLHVVFSASSATVKQYQEKFHQIFNYTLIDNLDLWNKYELISYARCQLETSQQFSHKTEIDSHVRNLMNIHKKLCKIKPHTFTHINFLNFVKTFCHIVKTKRQSLRALENRYKTGIEKLKKADEQMNFLQKELQRLQPELVKTSLETTVLMSTIERETIEIENAREVVAANEFKANEAATKAQALKVECEKDLAEAIPVLEAAVDALKCLNQTDISMLKTMRFPPQGVRLCMEAVCLLLGEKPARIIDPIGNTKVDYWVTGQKVLSDIHFLQRIRNFQRDKVPNKLMLQIRAKYLSLPEFDAENIKASSLAAEGLCLWVRAIDAYNRISKVVEPKKEKLKKAELMVKQHMKQLDIKRKALQEVTERLQRLSDQFSQMSQKKQELQNQIQACETKVSRSEKLLSALKSEQARWDKNVGDLKKESGTYLQQVMVGSALIEYLGNMDYQHRTRIIQSISPLVGLGRHEFSFRSILEHTSPLWSERKDSSAENYIIVVYSRKVALIVDPQDESLKSLQLMCGSHLVQVDLFSTTLQAVVVATIGMGHPMLIDNVSEPIPLLLAQLIDPKIVVQGGSRYIQLGSKLWHYSTDFRLYLRTERPASTFSKEFLQKVCVVNIALGTRVIQDNLMELFLTVNAFQLTSKKDELIAFKAKTVNEIDMLEEGILEVLSKTKTADLENDRAIEMLVEVKQKSVAMGKANEELVRIEEQLTQLRHRFFGVAEFAARLINVALSLSKLSPFYARTIRYYFDIFTEAVPVDVTNLSEDAIDEINQNVLKAFLWRTGKSLFGEHRKIFEFLACNQFTFKSFSLLSEKKFSTIYSKHVPITQPELNLRQQVFNMDSRLPLIILLSSRSNYVVRMLYSLAEQMPKVKTTQIAEGPANGAQAVPADEGNVVVGRRKIQVLPVEDIHQLDCEKCLLDDDWLIVQNCQRLTGDEISALEGVIEKISESLDRKVSFRMFVVMYPEAGVAPHALLDKCNVLTVEEEFTLKNFLLYCYSNLSPAKLHECFVSFYKRDLLYRLCCFHFVLLERSKYGIFGWASSFPITISQFEAAVSLLKDVALAHEKVAFSTILRNVLEVAYLGDISIPQDLKVFATLARWIFQGLSQNDTTPIESIFIRTTIPQMSESVRELIMGSIKFPKDKVLSGLHPYTTSYCKLTKIKKLHHTIRVLLADDTVTKPSEEAGNKALAKHSEYHEDHKFLTPMGMVSCEDELEARFDYCIQIELRILEERQEHRESESYLKGLLRNRNVDRIILAYFHRPMAIFEVLKLKFAKKHNVSYHEVDCHATLKYPGAGVDSIELAECFLLAADYDKDYGCLREPQDQKPFTLLDTIWVVVQRQFGDTPSVVRHASLPLYHKFSSSKLSGGEIDLNIGTNDAIPHKYLPILDVDVETNLPESHWLLRGAKFTTFMPYMD